MKADQWKKEEIAEDYCFVCKDGGHLRVCDFKNCLKAYHSHCVGKDAKFLDDDNRWTCGLHTCKCRKNSIYQCFCCPVSYCHSCIKSAEFVQVKKIKGFCINCLRLAKMIEENRNVDSDGEEVDFSNTETYEFLFKDYWVMVKDQEGLSLVDVQSADKLLKSGENFQSGSDSDKQFEEDSASEPDDLEDECDDGNSSFKGFSGRRGRRKTQIKKSRGERTFTGWASHELVKFLASLGKDTSKPLTQVDVTEIVKEYVQSKNLFQPNKKKRKLVIPDEKLHSLFRKKKLKYHKIFDLVKGHLAEERSDPDDELSFGSEEDEDIIFAKRQRKTSSEYKSPRSELNQFKKKVVGPSKSCFVAMVADNIKLTYLKKSLMLELLKNPGTFEAKTLGCFVRVKNDPKDFYYSMKKAYQLGQVKGVKKALHTYKIGETTIDVVLRVSNIFADVKISMLSDDDIEEEECEDLKQLVKKGLFKPPTVVELESKINSVHKDIIHHWIVKEITKLQKQIDRANEKGWRRELNEYIDRRELLRTPEEQMRLMEEIPEVIADIEGDTETNVAEPLHLQIDNKGLDIPQVIAETNEAVPLYVKIDNNKGLEIPEVTADIEGDIETNVAEPLHIKIDHKGLEIPDVIADIEGYIETNVAEPLHLQIDNKGAKAVNSESVSGGTPRRKPGTYSQRAAEEKAEGCILAPCAQTAERQATEIPSENRDSQVIAIKDKQEDQRNKKPADIPIINLDDDEDDDAEENAHVEENGTAAADACDESNKAIWQYLDPLGNTQGPFTLTYLRSWKECGYFLDDFKVWRSGECEADAILLNDALSSVFPDF